MVIDMNIFTPDYKLNVISDNEYPEKVAYIEKVLENYAVEGMLRRDDGMKLAWRYFPVEGAKASVVIIHGFTEFYRKYDELCWYLIKMGYNVFIYDQRGHGLSAKEVSDPRLIHVDSFYDYAADLDAIIDSVVLPRSGGLPVYALTHSMGGSVAGLYLVSGGDKLSKVAMTSPMICPKTKGIPIRAVKQMIRHDAEKTSWNSRFRYSGEFSPTDNFRKSSDMSLVRYEHIRRLRLSDKRYQSCTSTNRWAYEAICTDERILNNASIADIHTEIMIISAGRDKVVKNNRQRRLSRKLGCPMVTFRGAKHSVFMSDKPILEKYLNTVISFFEN